MKLGVFITTHLQKGYRHGSNMENSMFIKFRDNVIEAYRSIPAGVDFDIHIMDTGSTDPMYLQWIANLKDDNIYHIDTPNHCGFAAGLKHLMHGNPLLADKYDYIMVSTDENGGVPTKSGWGKDLIEKYNACDNLGVMGRFLDKIRLSSDGLIDHRNCCPQIAAMHGIKEVTVIPHLHAHWWLMNKKTLTDLAKAWWDPIHSVEGMKYQKQWEDTDFCVLADMKDNRKTLDNVHIGRETDITLRIQHIGYKAATYKGDKFYPNGVDEFICGYNNFYKTEWYKNSTLEWEQ